MPSRPTTLDARAPSRLTKLIALSAVTAFVVGAAPSAEQAARLERLRAMLPSERQQLAANLKRFDALPDSERQAVRQLDKSLAELPPVDRQRYLGVLRRYHLWLRSQNDATRTRLASLDDSQRLAAVEKDRTRQRQRRESAKGRTPGFNDLIQVSALVDELLVVSALETRLWLMLQPEQRTRLLAKAPNAREQRRQLDKLVDDDKALAAARDRLSREFNLNLAEMREALAAKRAERGKGQALPKNGPLWQLSERRFDLNKYVRGRTPQAVTARNLERFEDAMPPWIRASFDPLPPDAAVRRLRILYRLVFPAPEELPEPKAPARSQGGQRAPRASGDAPF